MRLRSRGDDRTLQPPAIRVKVEIVARLDRRIHVGDGDAMSRRPLGLLCMSEKGESKSSQGGAIAERKKRQD